MKKILLIIPFNLGKMEKIPFSPHYGIAQLSTFLVENKIEVRVVDLRLDSLEVLYSILNEFKPDFVGATATSMASSKSYEILSLCKSRGFKTIIGGPHVSVLKKKVLGECNADFAVKGEGEFTIFELLTGKNLREIKGLVWREGDNIVENEDRGFIDNLDLIPFPRYESFNLERYLCFKDKHINIMTSRGCPGRCIYCSVNLSMGRKFRARSPESVISEIIYWYDRGFISFGFGDDCFSFDLARAKKICDLIIEKNLKIKWFLMNGIRVNFVDDELMKKMKESGCSFVYFGVESGNQKILNNLKKGITIEQVRNAVSLADKHNIPKGLFFIIGSPGETFNNFLESYNLAKSLPIQDVRFYNLVPYPGTELYDWIDGNANWLVPYDSYLDSANYWEGNPVFETDYFTAVERKKAYRLGYELYLKLLLQYKFGREKGFLAWMVLRNKKLEALATKFALGSKFGNRIVRLFKRN